MTEFFHSIELPTFITFRVWLLAFGLALHTAPPPAVCTLHTYIYIYIYMICTYTYEYYVCISIELGDLLTQKSCGFSAC
jgi:hypothetical protein